MGVVEPFADDPIDSKADDQLDHYPLVGRIIAMFDATRAQTPSGVGVLAGPWGSGKSSVLRMLEHELKSTDSWAVVTFNPWLLSDASSLVVEFLGTVSSALPANEASGPLRKQLAAYASAIAPLAGAVRVLGMDLGKVAEFARDRLSGNQSLDGRRRALEESLGKLDGPVLVVLDDLDRLHPSELLLVLKLVRLVGRLPNVYYLLAFDEQTVVDLLVASELGGADEGRAQRALTFLEKIYQCRVDIPPLHESRQTELLDRALDAFFESHDISLTIEDQGRLSTAFYHYMAHHLKTPRRINRYVTQLDIYYPLLEGEVDVVDFLLISFLRAAHPRLHDLLARRKDDLTLTFKGAMRRDDTSMQQRRQVWEERLAQEGDVPALR